MNHHHVQEDVQEEIQDMLNFMAIDDGFDIDECLKIFRYCLTTRDDFMEYVHSSNDIGVRDLPSHLLDENDDFIECKNRAEYVDRAMEWMVLCKLRKWRQFCCNLGSAQMQNDTYLHYLNEDCTYHVKLLGFKAS